MDGTTPGLARMIAGRVAQGGASNAGAALGVTIAIICSYAAAALLLIPIAQLPAPYMPGVIPLFVGGLLFAELPVSFLLFVYFRETRSWSILVLGCAYLYSASMSVAQLATFPGALLPQQPLLPVSEQTAAWIFVAWNTGFALLVLAAVSLEAWFSHLSVAPERSRHAAILGVAAVAGTVGIAFVAAVNGGDALAMISEGRFTPAAWLWRLLAAALLGASIAVILFRIRARSYLYLWLSLTLTAVLFHNILAGAGGARFTLGWMVGRLSWLIAACVLFIYFLQQFSRQHRLLVRTQHLLGDARMQKAPDPLAEMETRLDTFVAKENIERYKAMLESELDDVHRHLIGRLLVEEESRLRQFDRRIVP
jgi:hypothetical protein